MAIYDADGNLLCKGIPTGDYTDAECVTAFMSYMAGKCSKYGMTGTTFANPSGLTLDSVSTPQDLLKLGFAVASNPKALDIWATKTQDFSIGGPNERTITVTNNSIASYNEVFDPAGYKFLGGKGGSLTMSGYDRAMIALADVESNPVLFTFMARGQTSYNNRIQCAKEICDMVKASLNGQTPTQGTNLNTLVTDGGGYAACLVPPAPAGYVNLESPAELLTRAHSVSGAPTASRRPASTTKTMTMLCALDYIDDPREVITLKSVDIIGGSGSTFYAGDTLQLFEALQIMMSESSNTLATAMARIIGWKILVSENQTA